MSEATASKNEVMSEATSMDNVGHLTELRVLMESIEHLTSLDIDELCQHSDKEDEKEEERQSCNHLVQVGKDELRNNLGLVSGKYIYLYILELLKRHRITSPQSKIIHFDHLKLQHDDAIKDVITKGSLKNIASLIEDGIIPAPLKEDDEHFYDSYSKEFRFAIASNRKHAVHIFMKQGFSTNHPEYYRAAIATKNVDIINLVLFNPSSVKKVMDHIVKRANESSTTRSGDNTNISYEDVFVFIVKYYGDKDVISSSTLDFMCSSDNFVEHVKFIEDNTKNVLLSDMKMKWIKPEPKVPFITFWINNGSEKVAYLGKLQDGAVKNPKMTILFCNELLGDGVSNVSLL